jgi:hypothetical protein
MKAGSLVQYIKGHSEDKHLIIPDKNVIYSVRQVFPKLTFILRGVYAQADSIYLEEIINEPKYYPFSKVYLEDAYMMESFREVLPPIEDIEQCVNENTLELETI